MCEEIFMEEVKPGYKHHEEGAASQTEFCRKTCALIESFEEFGNPFLETGSELIILNSRVCADSKVVSSIRTLESLGTSQYLAFKEDVFVKRTRKIKDPIIKNSLTLFKKKQYHGIPLRHHKFKL